MTMATRLQRGSILTTARNEPAIARLWEAEGSYSNVYRGAYGLEGLPCALKIPKPEIPESAELVRREGPLLSAVSSGSVVRLLDEGMHDGAPFLVLEWIDGTSLADTIRLRRRLSLRQSLEITEQIASGLAAFHARGLAHGDVRGENVLLSLGRGAVLIDPHTMPVGVPAGGEISPTGDLRALAGILHQMLTGEESSANRLNASAGYNRSVVTLWERLKAGTLMAAELAEQSFRLRQSI